MICRILRRIPLICLFSKVTGCWDCFGIAEGLRLVAACFDAFNYLKPKTWTLENPDGLLSRFIAPIAKTVYHAHDMKAKKTMFWSNNRALKRALIPQHIRQKILEVS